MAGAICCLLCLENLDDPIGHIAIDSKEGKALQAQQIIEQYFMEEVNTASAKTRTVCRQCWETVSTFHQFYLRVQRAHIALVQCDMAHNSESWSEDGAPHACEEQIEEKKVDIERLLLPPNESNIIVEELHINDIKQEEMEFAVSSSEDAFESKTEQLPKKKQKRREKSLKADAFIAENFDITCYMCGVAAKTFAELQLHFQMEHQTSGYVICCGRKLKHRASLVDHLYLHRNPQHFKCPKCGKAVSSSVALHNHIRAHRDTKKRLFKCDDCEKTFSSRATLKRHAEIHIQERPYPCAECGKTYPSKEAMTHHLKVIHQNAYVKICEACGKSVRGDKELQLHMQKHTGQKSPIKCDKCDRILSSERGLKLHMLTVHQGVPQTCPICFRVSQSLRAHKHHMNYMHKLTPKHACTLCDKVFKRPAHLKEHIRSHTREVSFACMFCPRMYSSEISRSLHYKKKHPKEWEERKRALRPEKAVEQSGQ